MGRRNADRIRDPPDPLAGLTLGEVRRQGWAVRASCGQCATRLHVEVDVMIRLLGADFILWGRAPQCRAFPWDSDHRCTGRVTFHARAIPGGRWVAMTASAAGLKLAAEVRGRRLD